MTGWNLPPGCTQDDIERAMGDYDDDPRDGCEHEETEIDVCTSRVECQICGAGWWATKEQVDGECERIAAYAKWADRENRREYWREWYRWLFGLRPAPPDDEIPF